ncbi:TonB-dependent receptor [Paucihalobacter sp.]|uniref:TonB-dependent receptor n=1 Tax=Paucihalobacter sp. TaxID=2850405 RepID=UPI003D161CE8
MKTNYIFLLFLFSFSTIFSQNGNIKGVVTDAFGLFVPGANILIESINKGSISDENGNYLILGVPEGTYEVVVKYLGFEDVTMQIVVTAGQTIVTNFKLSESPEELAAVELRGFSLNSQARALNTQRNKANITNIVSTDQIGKFPDANIGDAMRRIPGITMQVDQGESRNIIVRGLAPELNSVTLNGSRIPSAEGDNRNVQMDLIPSDMIQTIEVNKAVTPDMDADALGGSVNLVTRSSPQSFRLAATAGTGINFITNKRILNGSFLVGDRSKDRKFGWMIAASINDNDFGSDNVEAVWANEAESPLTGEDITVNPYVEENDIRVYLVQRVRRSFSANFDYAFNENNKIAFKSMYNWRDDRENRYRLRYDRINPVFEDGTENIVSYTGRIRRQTKGGIPGGRIQNTRLEEQRMYNFTLTGEHLVNSLQVDWLISAAKASEDRPNERYTQYQTGSSIALAGDFTNPRFPSFRPTDPSQVTLDRFNLNSISEENQETQEEDFNAFVNFTLPSDFFGNGDGIIKFGGRLRLKDKFRNNNFFEYDPTGDNPQAFGTLAVVPTRDFTNPDFLAGSQYAAGSFMSPEFLGSLNLTNPALFEEDDVPDEYLRANYNVSEDVFAGYIMANQKVSDKLSILAGVRLETTKITATGKQIENEDDEQGDITDESSYTNILPGVHFKYDLSNKTVFRLAWTNTLARPNYVDLVPTVDILFEDNVIVLGNLELDPTTSMNFDFMAEHYFDNVGILSGGAFYKRIDNFIYTQIGEVPVGETNAGFRTFQPQNGDDAYVTGAEISFQRQLDFLPGFAKNFGIFLNYTYLNSKANGIRNEDGDVRGDLDLPGATPNMFNASLSYGDNKFTARLSANYSDAYIDELGGNNFEDRYYDEQFFLDFNVTYAIDKNLRIYADLNNITNQPLRYFQGVRNRTQQMEYYERRLTFGLKYDLF